MEALFCPVCCGDYLLGEVFEHGEVPRDVPKEELSHRKGATIVLDAGEGKFQHSDVVLHLPKIGKAAIDGFCDSGRAALICQECYTIEPIDKANVQLI